MKARPWTFLLHCILVSGLIVEAIEPVSTSLLVGTGAAMLGRKIYRYLYETCDENWVDFNATGENVITMYTIVGFDHPLIMHLCIMSRKSTKMPLHASF